MSAKSRQSEAAAGQQFAFPVANQGGRRSWHVDTLTRLFARLVLNLIPACPRNEKPHFVCGDVAKSKLWIRAAESPTSEPTNSTSSRETFLPWKLNPRAIGIYKQSRCRDKGASAEREQLLYLLDPHPLPLRRREFYEKCHSASASLARMSEWANVSLI